MADAVKSRRRQLQIDAVATKKPPRLPKGTAVTTAEVEPRHEISPDRLAEFRAKEAERYRTARRKTEAAIGSGISGYYGGVPMHWMRDWPMPFPILVDKARGAT